MSPIRSTALWVIVLLAVVMPRMALGGNLSTDFEFDDTSGVFTLGMAPNTVTFMGGESKVVGILDLYHSGLRAWMIEAGNTGTITFETPAASVTLFLRNEAKAPPVASTLTVYDTNDNVIATFTGTDADWTEVRIVQNRDLAPVNRMTLANTSGDGYAVIDDFSCVSASVEPLAPQIVVTPETLAFGEVLLEDTRRSTFAIRNDGTADLDVMTIALTDVSGEGFSLVRPQTPFALAPQETKPVEVSFTPLVSGPVTATVAIESNDSDSPVTILPLSGEGVELVSFTETFDEVQNGTEDFTGAGGAQFTGGAALVVGVGEFYDTGAQAYLVGGADDGEIGTVTVTLPRPATHISMFMVGDNRDAPEVGNDICVLVTGTTGSTEKCAPPLPPGETFMVDAIDDDIGTFDTVRFTSDAGWVDTFTWVPDGAAATPEITLMPMAIDFGERLIDTSTTETIEVKNVGTGDLEVSSMTLTANRLDVIVSTFDAPLVMSPGAVTNVDVTFTPSTPGLLQGTLEIASNDRDEPISTVPVSGAGAVGVAVNPGVANPLRPIEIAAEAGREDVAVLQVVLAAANETVQITSVAVDFLNRQGDGTIVETMTVQVSNDVDGNGELNTAAGDQILASQRVAGVPARVTLATASLTLAPNTVTHLLVTLDVNNRTGLTSAAVSAPSTSFSHPIWGVVLASILGLGYLPWARCGPQRAAVSLFAIGLCCGVLVMSCDSGDVAQEEIRPDPTTFTITLATEQIAAQGENAASFRSPVVAVTGARITVR